MSYHIITYDMIFEYDPQKKTSQGALRYLPHLGANIYSVTIILCMYPYIYLT